MRKLTLVLALIFSVSAINAFAGEQTDKEKKAEKKKEMMMKLAPGKSCSKKCADDKEKSDKKVEEAKKP